MIQIYVMIRQPHGLEIFQSNDFQVAGVQAAGLWFTRLDILVPLGRMIRFVLAQARCKAAESEPRKDDTCQNRIIF